MLEKASYSCCQMQQWVQKIVTSDGAYKGCHLQLVHTHFCNGNSKCRLQKDIQKCESKKIVCKYC